MSYQLIAILAASPNPPVTQYLRKASTADELSRAVGTDCARPEQRDAPGRVDDLRAPPSINPLPRTDPVSPPTCDADQEPGRSDASRPAVGAVDPAGLSSFRAFVVKCQSAKAAALGCGPYPSQEPKLSGPAKSPASPGGAFFVAPVPGLPR
jgi:hypothetical protein